MKSKAIAEFSEGYGRKKAWAKVLKSVDVSKQNGYAFEGEFIRLGQKQELNVGSYVLKFEQGGSHKHPNANVSLYRIIEKGLETVEKWEKIPYYGWALEVRDQIAEYVNTAPESPLAKFSTEELLAELKRRGPTVGEVLHKKE